MNRVILDKCFWRDPQCRRLVVFSRCLPRGANLRSCLREGIASHPRDARLLDAITTLFLRGRAAFKHRIAANAPFDPALLPYNQALLDYLAKEKGDGRHLVLATAANHTIANAVANHIGLFDEVVASDETQNLKGRAKAAALCARFGRRGFAYAGNDKSDLSVWEASGSALLVNVAPAIARRARNGLRRTEASDTTRIASISAHTMDELNGRMIACQLLVAGLIARVANDSRDPLRFLSDFRDEMRAVVAGVRIAGSENSERAREVAKQTVDELFSLMKPPSVDEAGSD